MPISIVSEYFAVENCETGKLTPLKLQQCLSYFYAKICVHNRLTPLAEHNTDMLINNAVMAGESAVALRWARRIRDFPSIMATTTPGDRSTDYTHLPLVQVALLDLRALHAIAANS